MVAINLSVIKSSGYTLSRLNLKFIELLGGLRVDWSILYKRRLALIIILLVITKIVAFVYLFNFEFREPYGKLELQEWWLIFHRWDSAFYDRIAAYGYEHLDLRHWAFLPGFPLVIRAIYIIIGHSGVATALAGLIFGVLWVPIYYKLALMYVDEGDAFHQTLFFTFFPTVYLFSSIGYSEGLWLTSTLLGWYFYLKNRHIYSSAIFTLSALTRIPGFVLPAVIFLRSLLKKDYRRAIIHIMPFATLILWCIYGFIQTGDFFIIIKAQRESVWNPHLNFVEVFLIHVLSGRTPSLWDPSFTFILLAVAIAIYAYLRAFDVDNNLGIYSVCLLALYLYSGYFLSLPRFLPFTFPIWMSIRVKKKYLVYVYVFFGYLLSLILWSAFLNDLWVA